MRSLERPIRRALAALDALANRAYGWAWNPLHQTGTVAVAMLLVLIVTGLYLVFFYRLGAPHPSVVRLADDPWLGSWIRTLHRYASGLFVAAGILHGITRDTVLRLGRDLGYEVREMTIPREMLYLADEAFFCGTAVEITPIRSIDRVPVGEGRPGRVTRALQAEFMSIAKGKVPDRHNWLTPVPVAAGVR